MYNYGLFEMILIFYIYCFLGWVIESAIVTLKERRFINRGFLRLPIMPIYGVGSIITVLTCIPIRKKPILVFVICSFIVVFIEYLFSWVMEKSFKIKYWEHYKNKYNINGRVCLKNSSFLCIFSLLIVYKINKIIEDMLLVFDSIEINIIVIILTCITVIDMVYSICNVRYFNKNLSEIKKIKVDLCSINKDIVYAKSTSSHKAEYILYKKSKELHKEYKRLIEKVNLFYNSLLKCYPYAKSKNLKVLEYNTTEKV